MFKLHLAVLTLAISSVGASIYGAVDKPWCKANAFDPPDTYSRTPEFLTFEGPRHSPIYKLKLSDGRFCGDYPDAINYNGAGVKDFGAVGQVLLNAEEGSGHIKIEFTGEIRPGEAEAQSGDWKIESNGKWLHTVPFMRNGISTNFIQHGCSKQGEAGFPQLKSYFSTWGGCNVWLDGKLLYEDLWLHTMYSNRFRDVETKAIWADAAHTEYYSPANCYEDGGMQNNKVEFSFIVARWCEAANPNQAHPESDINIVFSFPTVEDLSLDLNEPNS